MDEIKILFTTNENEGFSDYVTVAPGTTVDQFLRLRLGNDYVAADRTIRVNREPTAMDYALKNQDRLTVTPRKIAGAVV